MNKGVILSAIIITAVILIVTCSIFITMLGNWKRIGSFQLQQYCCNKKNRNCKCRGKVAKGNVVEDNILKLEHRSMTFGIEVEFQLRNGHTAQEIAQELFELKLSACNRLGTYDEVVDTKRWRIIKENTCDFEIISPILTDRKKCWEEINQICCLLGRYGAYTDDTCAFHIHVGVEGVLSGGEQWAKLLYIYRQLEPITCVLAKGEFDNVSRRRLQEYALTMAMADTLLDEEDSIDKNVEQLVGDLEIVDHYYPTRNVGLNLQCMAEDAKMVEFRTFNGTINFPLMQTYIMYVCNLVDKVSFKKEFSVSGKNVLERRNITKSYVDKVIDYLTNDKYVCSKLRDTIMHNGNMLDDFTWDMLNGKGEVHVIACKI